MSSIILRRQPASYNRKRDYIPPRTRHVPCTSPLSAPHPYFFRIHSGITIPYVSGKKMYTSGHPYRVLSAITLFTSALPDWQHSRYTKNRTANAVPKKPTLKSCLPAHSIGSVLPHRLYSTPFRAH